MIFDTHCHYNDESFDQDREELLRSLPEIPRKARKKRFGLRELMRIVRFPCTA